MAKIGNLEVNRINIANNAVTGIVTSATSIVVSNGSGAPITLGARVDISWVGNGQGFVATLGVTVRVQRSRGGIYLINRTLSYEDSNLGSKNVHVTDGALDADASTSETYTLTVNLSPAQSSASVTSKEVQGLYTKR